MTEKHLENGVVEYDFEKAIVRIHPGKRTEEERKAALVEAAKEFWKALQKVEASKGNTLIVDSNGQIVSIRKGLMPKPPHQSDS